MGTAFRMDGKPHIRIEGFETVGYGSARAPVTRNSPCWIRDMYGRGQTAATVVISR